MAIEAGALFIDFASMYIDETALPMHQQVDVAKPRGANDSIQEPTVLLDDINDVFDWCIGQIDDDWSGEDRPDIRAMVTLAHRLDRLSVFENQLSAYTSVEDPMLAAIMCQCAPEQFTDQWQRRLNELTGVHD